MEEAEVTEEGMRGSRTPERNRESMKKEWQKCMRNKCWRHNMRRHSQVGIPEWEAAHAKEIATQVLGVQLPDEQWRRREKRN